MTTLILLFNMTIVTKIVSEDAYTSFDVSQLFYLLIVLCDWNNLTGLPAYQKYVASAVYNQPFYLLPHRYVIIHVLTISVLVKNWKLVIITTNLSG